MPDDSTALQVLTTRELSRGIASWMPGWPVALDEFVMERVIVPANSGRRAKKRMATEVRRRLMQRALGGRTLPMAIVQELRHADDEPRALQLLAMVHDLALQSATLRTKDTLSFEQALSHALLHGARGPVVQWLLDMQLHTQPHRPTGASDESDEWTTLWCDAIEGFADDVRTLDALRAHMFVDLTASESASKQAREALRVRSEASLELLQWCRAAWPQFKVPFEVVDAAAAQGKQDVVSWLCEDEHSERFTSRALQNALRHHHYDTFVYLLRRCDDPVLTTIIKTGNETETGNARESEALTQTVTQRETLPDYDNTSSQTTIAMLDKAAADGDIALVRALNELAPVAACTTAAMDAAATYGHLQIVEYLHTRRSEGCTLAGMDGAAANGHLDVVLFLHEKRSEGCTTKAVDDAACNGHLDVVRFLLTNRSEGCTSDAMDNAAANGHLDVLTYLHESGRGVRCTSRAWAETSSAEVVAFLRRHYVGELTTSGLANLLLRGMFDEWKELRLGVCEEAINGRTSDGGSSTSASTSNGSSLITKDGAQEAMIRAGREQRPSVIRFLTRDMGRRDLEPWAMVGAAELQSIGWLHMIHEIAGDGCQFSAVVKAIDADTALPKRAEASRVRESVTCVLFLASICKDATVADAVAYALSVRNSGLASELEMLEDGSVTERVNELVDPMFRLVELPDWAIHMVARVKDLQGQYMHFDSRMGPWNDYNGDPWCRLACAHGDLATLKLFRQLGHSPDLLESASYVADSAHCIAARGGHLDILQWLLAEGFASPPLEKLLETAVLGGAIEVAQWLVSQLPEGFILEVIRYHCYWDVKEMHAATVDWFFTTPCVRAEFDPFSFALQAAEQGCVDLLRALHARDPNTFGLHEEWANSILGEAINHGQLQAIKCLLDELHIDPSIILVSNVTRAVEGGCTEVLDVISDVRPDFFETTEQLDVFLMQSARCAAPKTLEWVLRRLRSRERGVGDLDEAFGKAKRNRYAPGYVLACHLLGLEQHLNGRSRHSCG